MSVITTKNELKSKIIDTLRRSPKGKIREELVTELSLPRTTIYDNMRQYLIDKKILTAHLKLYIGRPKVIYFLPEHLESVEKRIAEEIEKYNQKHRKEHIAQIEEKQIPKMEGSNYIQVT